MVGTFLHVSTMMNQLRKNGYGSVLTIQIPYAYQIQGFMGTSSTSPFLKYPHFRPITRLFEREKN